LIEGAVLFILSFYSAGFGAGANSLIFFFFLPIDE